MRQLPLARRVLKNVNWIRHIRWAMRSAPPPAEVPLFFIVGRGKSGTSWLMEMLDEHPEILCKGEGQFFGRGKEQVEPHARSLYRALLDAGDVREWSHHSAWMRGADYEQEAAELAGAATARVLARRLAGAGKRIAGDKTPLNGPDVVAQIAAVMPGAKVLHMIRDGRDVVISSVHHLWNNRERVSGRELEPEIAAKRDRYRDSPESFGGEGESLFTPGHLENAARHWRQLTEAAVEDGRRLLGDRYLEVRYEDMLERPEPTLERVLGFLGADAEPGLLERCVERTRFERVSGGRRPGEEDSASFRRKGVAGDWRRAFTAEDRAIFEREAGELLQRLGYETGGEPR